MKLMMSTHLGDASSFVRFYRASPFEDRTEEEIEELRQRMLRQLADGSIDFENPRRSGPGTRRRPWAEPIRLAPAGHWGRSVLRALQQDHGPRD